MEFSRQEYWSKLPFPTSRDLSDPGIKPMSLASLELIRGFFTISTTWETPYYMYVRVSAIVPQTAEALFKCLLSHLSLFFNRIISVNLSSISLTLIPPQTCFKAPLIDISFPLLYFSSL